MSPRRLAPLLVVEDSADDLFLFTRILKRSGVLNPLHIASDGEEGIRLLQRTVVGDPQLPPPLLAFVDVKMPRMDGFELLAWVRAQPVLATMPVVMLSSSTEARDIARAARLGAQFYFAKYPGEKVLGQLVEAATSPPPVSECSRATVPGNLLAVYGGT